MIHWFTDYISYGRSIRRAGVSPCCQLSPRVDETFVSRVHEQPIVAQKVHTDDGWLDVGYHKSPCECPSEGQVEGDGDGAVRRDPRPIGREQFVFASVRWLVGVFCCGNRRLCRPQCPRGRTSASPCRWQKCGGSPCRRRLPLLRTAGPVSLHPFARRLALVRPVSERSMVVAEVEVSRSLSRSFSWSRPVTPSRFGSQPRTKLALRRAHFRSQLRYLFAQGVDDGKSGFACCLGLCRLLDNGRQTRCVPVALWDPRVPRQLSATS